MIELEEFDKVEMRVGTALEVKDNKKSRNPAYDDSSRKFHRYHF